MSTEIVVTSDERLGLPSGSSMPLYFSCAGAYGMQAIADGQSVRVDDSNRDATRGTMLHKASELGDVSDIDEDDAETVTMIRAREEELVTAWLAETDSTLEDCTIYREVRLWVGCDYSVQLDTLVVNKKHKSAFCLDAKTGRKKVAAPSENWQLRAAAVAAFVNHGCSPIRTAIVQPMMERQPVCDYSAQHLNTALFLIVERLKYIKQPDLPRTPGTWCEFCRARHLCPEAKKSMSVVIGARSLNWDLVTAPEKLRLWGASNLAIDCATLLRDQIKADLRTDPDSVPGLKVAPDQHPVSISNPAMVALKLVDKAMVGFEMSRDVILDFLSVSKLSKAKALEIIRERTGMNKTDAERFLLVECADAVKEGFRAGSVSVVDEEPAK